jgi:hypothetical protein
VPVGRRGILVGSEMNGDASIVLAIEGSTLLELLDGLFTLVS